MQQSATDDDEWLERARQTHTADDDSPYVPSHGANNDERELDASTLTSTPSPVPADSNFASAIPLLRSGTEHNDSTMRVMPLPAPQASARRDVRVLPIAPRSSIGPWLVITCLLAAGLAVGAYFALPYVIDWYTSKRVPLELVETRAPETALPNASAAAPMVTGGTPEASPKPKKAKRAKATKKKVGAAEKTKKPRK